MKSPNPVILIVDDTPDNVTLLIGLLKDRYRIKIATSGTQALDLMKENPPDLVLLDVMMPDIDGYETCRRMKSIPELAEVPVIFLTARTQVEDEERGFELGASDFVTKPISPPRLLARIQTQLKLKESRDFLLEHNQRLEAEVIRRTRQVTLIQEVAVVALTALAETRDDETGAHIVRTKYYVQVLADHLKNMPQYRDVLSDDKVRMIVLSVPLHDIGKVGIPDSILLKPDRLTAEEFEIMKTHTTLGYEAIVRAEAVLGESESFLQYAKDTALCHHERWDGSGYPQGLSQKAIPLVARLMAVADVYDAMMSKRVYKTAIPEAMTMDAIKNGSGGHFDPEVVQAFLACRQEFLRIYTEHRDEITN